MDDDKFDSFLDKFEKFMEKEGDSGTNTDSMLIKKVEELRCLLSSRTVDPDRTILGSEPFETNTIPKEHRERIILKIMELVKKF